MLNIVIPMAGAGSRFNRAGLNTPKPLINIYGEPMIAHVIRNLTPNFPHQFIFICQDAHIKKYNLRKKLKTYSESCKIIAINGLTDGAACTVLFAKSLINNNNPLMIANSDQICDTNISEYIKLVDKNKLDGPYRDWETDRKSTRLNSSHRL